MLYKRNRIVSVLGAAHSKGLSFEQDFGKAAMECLSHVCVKYVDSYRHKLRGLIDLAAI